MKPIPEAASVILAAAPGSPSLLVVRRAAHLRFFGGYYAFPGGKVDAADASDASPSRDPLHTHRLTAVRELFEETGILLARYADGSLPASGPTLDRARRQLIEGKQTLPPLLEELRLAVRDEDLTLVGTVTTPEFAPTRYATSFFTAGAPAGQQVDLWPGELDEALWTTPEALLDRWERGECLIAPPTVMILEGIRGQPVNEAPERVGPLMRSLISGAIHPIYWAPDVRMIPLRTRSLPPTPFTNAYLVGSGPLYLIDPGASEPDVQRRLFDVLDASQSPGRRFEAVVLSHEHPDHVDAAAACAERYHIPVWAHRLTAASLGGRVKVARYLEDGDMLPLGQTRDGRPWALRVLHTPGHAAGHLCFYDPVFGLLFTGDMVSTASTVVIAPPEGDLAQYLESLRRLRRLPARLLLPGHGNASARPHEVIDDYLAHRAKREEMLLTALRSGPRSEEDLTLELYKGVPGNVMPLAKAQLSAGLEKLRREGRVEEASTGFWRLREEVGLPPGQSTER